MSNQNKLTAAEAGRRAADLAAQNNESSTIPSPHMSTLLAHAGVTNAPNPTNTPMAPPLHLATTYTRPVDGEYRLPNDAVYSREDNPTRLLLEQEVARLDGYGLPKPCQTTAWSSGLQAVTGLVLAHQSPLTVLLPVDLYHGTSSVLIDVLSRFGVVVQRVDWRQIGNESMRVNSLQRQLTEGIVSKISSDHSVVVWIETPSNPLCHVVDIEAVCAWARQHLNEKKSTTVVVDSTLAPPVIQQPLQHGADIVLQSATKYLAGHSDALLGTLTANSTTTQGQWLAERLPQVQHLTGGVASSLDSWLCLRGLRTLSVRVQQQCQTAQRVAEWLQEYISKKDNNGGENTMSVFYPGLPSHPQHAVAQRQMHGGFGGVLSLDVGTEPRAMALAAALQTLQRATSLGGTESLIEHRASIEPPGRVTSPPGLLRLSIGLEATDDLIADLSRALAIAEEVCGTDG